MQSIYGSGLFEQTQGAESFQLQVIAIPLEIARCRPNGYLPCSYCNVAAPMGSMGTIDPLGCMNCVDFIGSMHSISSLGSTGSRGSISSSGSMGFRRRRGLQMFHDDP